MNFGQALEQIKLGSKLRREGWDSSDQWIVLQVPDDMSKMTLPYIYINTVNNKNVPWIASQTDLLSDDWVVELGVHNAD